MNWKQLFALSVFAIVSLGAPALNARDKDKVRVVSPSKVDAAKNRIREKDATEWMTDTELKKLNEAKKAEKKQIIYFEYHVARDKWRGVYTDKIMLRQFSWWTFFGQNEMEAKVNDEMGKDLQPAFIVRSGNSYAMLFVSPDQYNDVRKILDELGIGEPKLKK